MTIEDRLTDALTLLLPVPGVHQAVRRVDFPVPSKRSVRVALDLHREGEGATDPEVARDILDPTRSRAGRSGSWGPIGNRAPDPWTQPP